MHHLTALIGTLTTSLTVITTSAHGSEKIDFDSYRDNGAKPGQTVCLPGDTSEQELCFVPIDFSHTATTDDDPSGILTLKGPRDGAQAFSQITVDNLIIRSGHQNAQHAEAFLRLHWSGEKSADVQIDLGGQLSVQGSLRKAAEDRYTFHIQSLNDLMEGMPLMMVPRGAELEQQFGYREGFVTHSMLAEIQLWAEQVITKALNIRAEATPQFFVRP